MNLGPTIEVTLTPGISPLRGGEPFVPLGVQAGTPVFPRYAGVNLVDGIPVAAVKSISPLRGGEPYTPPPRRRALGYFPATRG